MLGPQAEPEDSSNSSSNNNNAAAGNDDVDNHIAEDMDVHMTDYDNVHGNNDVDNAHEHEVDEDIVDNNVNKSSGDNADDLDEEYGDDDDGGGDNGYEDAEEQWLSEHFEQGIREVIDDQVQLVRQQCHQHYEQQLAMLARENQQLREQLLQQSRVAADRPVTEDRPRARVPLPSSRGESSRTGSIVCLFAILLPSSQGLILTTQHSYLDQTKAAVQGRDGPPPPSTRRSGTEIRLDSASPEGS